MTPTKLHEARRRSQSVRQTPFVHAATTILMFLGSSVALAGPLELEPPVTLGEAASLGPVVLAADGSWVYSVWRETNSEGLATIMLARSSDGAKSFEEAVVVRSGTSADFPSGVDRAAVVASGSHVFVAWAEYVNTDWRISLRRSSDHGATFSSAVPISAGLSAFHVRLAFSDERLHALFGRGSGLYVRTSTDSGQTFSSPVDMEIGTSLNRLTVAASGDSVWVAWDAFESAAWGVWLRRSSDGGQTFSARQPIATDELAPSLAVSADELYVASLASSSSSSPPFTRGGASSAIQLRVSRDGGQTFETFGTVSAAASWQSPGLVALPGLVSVAWVTGSGQAWMSSSRDQGASFDTPSSLGAANGNWHPGFATRGLSIHAAWGDNDSGLVRARRTKARPVVFVPGVAGSVLYDRTNSRELWPAVGSTHHSDLSLHPEDNPIQFDIVATEPIRAGAVFAGYEIEPIYGPFIDYLSVDLGLHLYDVTDAGGTFLPARLTEGGCDLGQEDDDGPTPELFLFPYDWRRDNSLNALRLADYLGCVRLLHPDTEVHFVTHSMGSLLARRTILDQAATSHPERLITIGAPWLGAPKMYNVLDTGDFGVPHILDSAIKHIIGSFDAAHQLIPSRLYTENVGPMPPLIEDGRDLDGDGVDDEVFTHDRLIEVTDAAYGQTFTPGTTGEIFHSHPGQDDWSTGADDIGYFHIYGEQSSPQTIGQVKTKVVTTCNFGFLCYSTPFTKVVLTNGDGTVPVASASRQGNGFDLNHPDATLWPVVSPSAEDDVDSEHNGLMRNPAVQQKVVEYLFVDLADMATPKAVERTTSGATAPPVPLHRVLVVGAASLLIQDEGGNELLVYPDQILGAIPGAASYRLGVGVAMVALPTSPARTFTVGLVTGSDPMALVVETGTEDEITRAVRFLDLDLVAGRSAMMTISGTTISDLAYDSTGDGVLDATLPPTVDVTGAEAADTVPPVITIDQSPSGNPSASATLDIEAVDAVSGVATAYYSLDGSQYQQVTGTIDVDPRVNPEVWVFADDAVGNRATKRAVVVDPGLIFADGFEAGNVDFWTSSQ